MTTNFTSTMSSLASVATPSKGDANIPNLPAPSFLSLPAELRLQVYSYILPHRVMPSKYTGLRHICRQIRAEFDHEALKHFPALYKKHPRSYVAKVHPRRPLVMSDISVVEFKLDTMIDDILYRGGDFEFLIPWRWFWVKTLIINMVTQGSPRVSQSGVYRDLRDVDDALLYNWDDYPGIKQHTEIDTFICRWYCGRYDGITEEVPEDPASWESMRKRIEMYCREANGDVRRPWIVTLESGTQEEMVEISWRRRHHRD